MREWWLAWKCMRSCSVTSHCFWDPMDQPTSLLWRYWSWLPFLAPGHLSSPGVETASLASPNRQADSLSLCYVGSPHTTLDLNLLEWIKSIWWKLRKLLLLCFKKKSFWGLRFAPLKRIHLNQFWWDGWNWSQLYRVK